MQKTLLVLFILFACSLVQAQGPGPQSQLARKMYSGTAIPTFNCSPGPIWRDFYTRTTTSAIYECTAAPNTWTLVVSGGVPGTVTTVSVVSANGQSGSVATATTTPAITLNNPTALNATTSIQSPFFVSAAADPADAGAIRLGNNEFIEWEKATPGTDWTLGVNASDILATNAPFQALTFNKITITQPASGGTLTIPDGITLNAGAGGTLGALSFITPGTGIATALGVNVGSAGAPVLFNGAGGTPSSLTLTSATGLPISTGLTGAGTGILTALGVNVGTAGAPVVNGGALGTPSSGTLTNATGLPTTGLTGTLQAAQEPAHTGDVTNSAGSLALSIAANAVTLAKLATQATNTVLGNATSGTAVPTALSVGTCSTSGSALTWTTNTGFGCNTSVAANTAATLLNARTIGGVSFNGSANITVASATGGFAVTGGATTFYDDTNGVLVGQSAGVDYKISRRSADGYLVFLGNQATFSQYLFSTAAQASAFQIANDGSLKAGKYGAGTATFDASGNITSVSDERVKRNIRPFSRGLNAITGLRPILYGYTKESGLDQTKGDYAGFSAQNVQKFIPEAVGHSADGKLSLDERPILAALVTGMQEQQRQIKALSATVAAQARTIKHLTRHHR